MTAQGIDKRGYSWPPFEAGNTAAVTHGAYSPRQYEPRAHELVEEMRGHLPWLTPAHRPALWAWAKEEARCEMVEQWLAARADLDNAGGMLDDEGEVRSATKLLLRLQASVANHRKELGMTPLAAARLGRDTAAGQLDVARLMAALDDEEGDDDA